MILYFFFFLICTFKFEWEAYENLHSDSVD